jgi:hypothetical protein
MGCGQTLATNGSIGARIVCTGGKCPRPTAADEILSDAETLHIVNFGDTTFALVHPLAERLDGGLLDCGLHRYIASGQAKVPPGRYRARDRGTGWLFDPLPDFS